MICEIYFKYDILNMMN